MTCTVYGHVDSCFLNNNIIDFPAIKASLTTETVKWISKNYTLLEFNRPSDSITILLK